MIDYASRAIKAKELQSNDLLNEIFGKIEAEALEAVLTAETDELRRMHVDRVKTVRAVRSQLQNEIDLARAKAKAKTKVA